MRAVIVGEPGPGFDTAIQGILERAGLTPEVVASGAAAREVLAAGLPQHDLRLLLLDAASNDDGLVVWLRDQARFFALPVIALSPAASEEAFRAGFLSGSDDVIARTELPGLARRANLVAQYDPSELPPVANGRVLVSHPSRDRRALLGRLLRMAGFEVVFSEGVGGADPGAPGPAGPFRFAVVSHRPADGLPEAILDSLRSQQAGLPVVVTVSSERGKRLWRKSAGLSSVAVTTDASPLHDVLYLANEILNGSIADTRRSPRILQGAFCSFREEGTLTPGYGITYTISGEGLYIRTLDAPPAGSRVWIELRPDDDSRFVHLRGEVAWSRAFGERIGIYSPPGFGVALDPTGSPTSDRRIFAKAFRKKLRRESK